MNKPSYNTMTLAVCSGILFLIAGTVAIANAQQNLDGKTRDRQEQQPPANDGRYERHQQQAIEGQDVQPQPGQETEMKKLRGTESGQVQKHSRGLQMQAAGKSSPNVRRVQKSERRQVWQQHRAQSWQAEHRTWQQRGGYDGYRIPEKHFHLYYGSDHWFRMNGLSLEIFGDYPRFQYEGYWFCLVDPWPEYWEDNWYEGDDMYIDYIGDGYYLCNSRYPDDQIAVTVCMN